MNARLTRFFRTAGFVLMGSGLFLAGVPHSAPADDSAAIEQEIDTLNPQTKAELAQETANELTAGQSSIEQEISALDPQTKAELAQETADALTAGQSSIDQEISALDPQTKAALTQEMAGYLGEAQEARVQGYSNQDAPSGSSASAAGSPVASASWSKSGDGFSGRLTMSGENLEARSVPIDSFSDVHWLITTGNMVYLPAAGGSLRAGRLYPVYHAVERRTTDQLDYILTCVGKVTIDEIESSRVRARVLAAHDVIQLGDRVLFTP